MKANILKKLAALTAVLAMVLCLAACGGGDTASENAVFQDGTYTARSSDFEEDESGNGAGYGEVTLELKDNTITACTFKMYELDGTLKDETYGSDMSKENRLKAQKAVQSADKYAAMLVDAGSLSGVDTISGATISYNEFVEAVNNALSDASAAE